MKQNFLKEMLSGIDGTASSKRGAFFWFTMLFTFLVLFDTFTGKHPQSIFIEYTFDLECLCLIAVFGEKFADLVMWMRGQKKSTTETIVAPKDATVVSKTTETN